MGLFGEWVRVPRTPELRPEFQVRDGAVPGRSAPTSYGAGFVNGNAFFIPKGSKDPAAAALGMYLMTDDPLTGDGHPECEFPPAEVPHHRRAS